MKRHPKHDDDFFIFMDMGFFVSVCARKNKTKAEVEEYVNCEIDTTHKHHSFECVDISIIRGGPSTPEPCPDAPGRMHWFLIAGTESELREAQRMAGKLQ